ncbi:MAG: hypothetical protein ISR45_06115, partial [Rhodospirillales bacterium]|nr:hypothetical protein [Rhodospirillales bacterium]
MFRRNKGDGEANPGEDEDSIDAPPLRPFASKGTHTPSKPPTRVPNLNGSSTSSASPKRPV